MKWINLNFQSAGTLFLFALIVFALPGCGDKCEISSTYIYYEPVYSTSAETKAAVAFLPPRAINNPGRIYWKEGILFINESGSGIHFIDNRDPANPVQLGFLNIPGNYDLAIRGNTLYADSYVDLVAFDVSNLSTVNEINRVESTFNHFTSMGMFIQEGKGFITDWKPVTNHLVSTTPCETALQPWGGFYYRGGIALMTDVAASFNSKTVVAPVSNTGIGGSMARFTVSGSHLYALDNNYLDIVDVSTSTNPKPVKEIVLNWQPETLFPFNTTLFIGTRSGMYIYDLINPEQPELLSQYEHVRSCDPVVVEGDYAFVTLYDGSLCQGFTNQLEVVNISNLRAPKLSYVYPFTNPHGLAIDNGTLFICDGSDGLKIFDATDVSTISNHPLAHYPDIQPLDIIAFGNVAMVIGQDGLYQYDYSDLTNIKLLSTIALVR